MTGIGKSLMAEIDAQRRNEKPRAASTGPTPEKLAASGTEHGHQTAFFAWAANENERWPELRWLHAIPNGGERTQSVALEMVAEGVKSGVLDVCLPVARGGFFGLYVEFKRPGRERTKNGGLSDNQIAFGNFITENGYCAAVAYSWQQGVQIVENYLRQTPTKAV